MQINSAMTYNSLASQAPQSVAGASASLSQNSAPTISAKQNLNSQPSQSINVSPTQKTNTDSSSNQEKNISSVSTENIADKKEEIQVKQVIDQLKARDTEVRAHEMAHLMVAGQYARGMSFTYQTGPDGKRYAIGGEVGIDTSPISGDPQATLEKARIIQQAALAPAEPSSQDQRVAQAAQQMMTQAMVELRQEKDNSETNLNENKDDVTIKENQSVDSHPENSIRPNSKPLSLDINNNQNDFPLAAMERQQFDVRLQINNPA